MKQTIRRRLCIIILTSMLLTLFLNYYFQILGARIDMYHDSQNKFRQIDRILEQNESDTRKLKEDLKEDCFIRAKAAAYIVQNHPEIIEDQKEMEKIAGLLQVDEFHLFDTEGNLYSGSIPAYFGMNFNSGEQMEFFLPMLENYDLELCQDITPNTAEKKLMQYAAVWREDRKGIVQIGLEPTRVLEGMKKNELSYIFSMVTAEKGTVIYAIDPESYEIVGSSSQDLVGKKIEDINLNQHQVERSDKGFGERVDGRDSYCVFRPGKPVILGIVSTNESLYAELKRSTLLVALYLTILSLIMIVFISGYIDRYILTGISSINSKLEVITGGNLDTKVEVDTTPEFSELGGRINQMVASLLDTTNKWSKILEKAELPIGVYEYNRDMKRVMVTSRVADILNLPEQEAQTLFSDYSIFENWLDEIRNHSLEQEKTVYILDGGRYVRLESFSEGNSVVGVIFDVTEDVVEKKEIQQERDIDLLTGVYSRRAFYRHMDLLFQKPEQLKHGSLIMADADNLKQVNDQYGHENGDRYLRGMADILKHCRGDHKLVARISGDEFIIFLYGCENKETLLGYIRELHEYREQYTVELTNGFRIPVKFSAGSSFYPEDGTDFHVLKNLADEAMYCMKRSSKEKCEKGV